MIIRNAEKCSQEFLDFMEEAKRRLNGYQYENLPELLGFEHRNSWAWVIRGASPWPIESIKRFAELLNEDPVELFLQYDFFKEKMSLEDVKTIAHENGMELQLSMIPHAA
jgi:hypothetical protein